MKKLFLLAWVLSAGVVFAYDDIDSHGLCSQCGMDRKAYGYSRTVVVYEDGAVTAACSLHCAVRAISVEQSRTVKTIQVADRDSHDLLDASKAFWVMGGDKRGVMTRVPKWAFGSAAAAENFIKKHGGKVVTWEEALAAAKEEIGEK